MSSTASSRLVSPESAARSSLYPMAWPALSSGESPRSASERTSSRSPADIISSKRFHRLVERLEQSYEYVIYDMPPVGTFVDAAILSTLVDGTIMVVKPGEVKRDELVDAYQQLQKAGANVLGICATFCEGTGSEYYYAYYTKDGERVDSDKIERKAELRQRQAASTPVGMPVNRRTAAGQDLPPMRGSHSAGRR